MLRMKHFRHALGAIILIASMLSQGTWALAGTTGGLSGTVVDTQTNAPVGGALVTAKSPSQTATTTSDAGGHFTFLSLTPDTYSVSATKSGYQEASVPGIVVFADTVQSASVGLTKQLSVIANVRSSSAALVKSGTTADVYSVNSSTMDKVSALGGGGSLNSAYSAVASVPGAIMPLNQTGYFQTVHIRGGDYDQVGYEFDGVPVNRSFDNYPSGALSSLGNSELQVYTGATPANSEGQGLAGYINQVIKTGTYPGFGDLQLGVGTPVFYHKISAEAGGASPNRMFSYYVGLGGYNQSFRYVDQNNAAKYQYLGAPFQEIAPGGVDANGNPICPAGAASWAYSVCYANSGAPATFENYAVGPGGYQQLPYNYGSVADIADRDVVMNFHFALPHRGDSGRDDLQLLWNSALLHNSFYSSINDAGGLAAYNLPNTATGAGDNPTPTYVDGWQSNCPTGTLLNTSNPASYAGCATPYSFPSSSGKRTTNFALDPNTRDTIWNDQEIIKVQYQKNMGSNAYARVYGYTYYSDWLQNGPNCAFNALFQYGTCSTSFDYELSSHTRGVSLQLADQISNEHLLQLQGNYTTANSIRDNNTQMYNALSGSRARAFVLVDPNNPYNGTCYNAAAAVGTQAQPTSCNNSPAYATWAKWNKANAGTIADYSGLTCGSGPCKYLVAENGLYATYNNVVPKFASVSLTDQWRPGSRWLFNLGLRDDYFEFDGSSTNPNDPARQFWFNAFNTNFCINNTNGKPYDKSSPVFNGGAGLSPTIGQTMAQVPCPTGYSALGTGNFPLLTNASGQVEKYNKLQPRISGTYTVDPLTVLRFSYGKYVEPPNAAYEQYNVLQSNLAYFLGTRFYQYGFTTPGHAVRPPTSDNFDFSFEHQFRGTDFSMKITPFYRKTKDQIQNFFLDQQTGFISGLNVGSQTSEGVELALSKGNFNANGLSGSLSFTYTNSYINYGQLANGLNITSQINADVQHYNSYTSYCATNFSDARCGGLSSAPASAAACFDSTGAPVSCATAGAVANPYFNAPVQPLLNGTANYPVYDIFPGGIGGSADSFEFPYAATLVLNYKKDKFAITPSFQFLAGNRYGSPETNAGIDPAAGGCTALTGGAFTSDPRYPYGAPGGSPYDATTCGGTIVIPNTYTHTFDLPGSFVNPSQFVMNLQLSYDVSPKITLVGTVANLVNKCFGGTKAPWTYSDSNVCAYGVLNNAGDFSPMGNVYNWTPANTQFPAAAQPFVKYPYGAFLGGVNVDGNSTLTPINFYLEARIKL